MSDTRHLWPDTDPLETSEWLEALQEVVDKDGARRAKNLLGGLWHKGQELLSDLPALRFSPYNNSIAPHQQAAYPGDLDMERRLENIMRWNAVMMVLKANHHCPGIGGHLSTYASAATLYEVGFHHFFKGPKHPEGTDLIFYQGHATPGIYARAYLEGRLTQEHLDHFRQEVAGKGLSSYPHPWLMPDFWQFPTVSMGLGPLHAIYQARFQQYLEKRSLKPKDDARVWAFLGDGECDEPETLGALSIAAREQLHRLVFVVNCNLQRLDGPVRGNGKIIQELEGIFVGAGWHVIKVIWDEHWQPLLNEDQDGSLLERLASLLDGHYQKHQVAGASWIRQDLFSGDARLEALSKKFTDEQLLALGRGGHSFQKVYAAYAQACAQTDKPVCILVKTVKGHLLGKSFEASNVAHQSKKLDDKQLKAFKERLQLPIADKDLETMPYYHPGQKSPEVLYLQERRRLLGGFLPTRHHPKKKTDNAQDKGQRTAQAEGFVEFSQGSSAEVSTTMAFVRLLRKLLRDPHIGQHIVPIVPDEARTFGMDAFFKEFGIYASHGQKYTPVDSELILKYFESESGQILEEGITEAGSMASFIAAATAYSTYQIPTVPFYLFYSMFGLQRTGDQVWAAADGRARGFLLGATAGRTTLNGEGLQHEDGHSHLLAQVVPNLLAYDPAFAFETAVIVQEGLRRMLQEQQDVFYYLTLYNENYAMPAQPPQTSEGILKGMYLFRQTPGKKQVALLGSGPLLPIALQAQEILAERFDVGSQVYSVTSYQQLYRQGRAQQRLQRLHMDGPDKRDHLPYITKLLEEHQGPVVAISDYLSELPSLVSRFIHQPYFPLGTNGLGRSDSRQALRKHFEVDAEHLVATSLYALYRQKQWELPKLTKAYQQLGIDPQKIDAMLA